MSPVKFSIIFLLLIRICCTKLLIPIVDEIKTKQSLKLCVRKAFDKYFRKNDDTLFVIPIKSTNVGLFMPLNKLLLEELFTEPYWPLIITNFSNSEKIDRTLDIYRKLINNYIIEIRSPNDIYEIVQHLKLHLWNPDAHFIVMSAKLYENPQEVTRQIVNTLWTENVQNTLILLPAKENQTIFNIYTWAPFHDGNCGLENQTELRLKDSCAFGETKKTDITWYINKMPKKFNGCIVKIGLVSRIPYSIDIKNGTIMHFNEYNNGYGIEVNILNTIGELLNLTMVYFTETQIGNVYENGSITDGLFLKLNNNEYDVVVSGLHRTVERVKLFDSSRDYVENPIIWCVPNQPIYTGLESLILIFDLTTWLLILFIYFLMSFLIWYACNYNHLIMILFGNFASLINSPTSVNRLLKLNKTNHFLRYLMGCFLLFCFCIDSAYITFLTSSLSNPRFEQKYDTFDDIFKSNLRTVYMENSKRLFSDIFEKYPNLENKYEDCENPLECIKRVAFKQDTAFVSEFLFCDKMYDRFIDKKRLYEQHLLHNIKRPYIANLPIVVYFRKGYPMYEMMDEILSRLIENGFIDKWRRNVFVEIDKNSSDLNQETEIFHSKAILMFSDLKPMFLLYLFGLFVGFIVFLIEISYKRFNKK